MKANCQLRYVCFILCLLMSLSQLSATITVTAEFDFDDTTATVDVEVTFSRLTDVTIGQVVTATNYIGYSGDQNGECYVYYHGDGTGEEDGTFDLMGARCPAV